MEITYFSPSFKITHYYIGRFHLDFVLTLILMFTIITLFIVHNNLILTDNKTIQKKMIKKSQL